MMIFESVLRKNALSVISGQYNEKRSLKLFGTSLRPKIVLVRILQQSGCNILLNFIRGLNKVLKS